MNFIGFGGDIMSNEEFLTKYDNGHEPPRLKAGASCNIFGEKIIDGIDL